MITIDNLKEENISQELIELNKVREVLREKYGIYIELNTTINFRFIFKVRYSNRNGERYTVTTIKTNNYFEGLNQAVEKSIKKINSVL